jgi:alpha-1,2-rhamnosyltransferase
VESAGALNVVCRPVVFHPRHGFVALSPDVFRDGAGNSELSSCARLKRRLEHWGLIGLARKCRLRFERSLSRFQSGFQRFSRSGLEFGPGDILLLLDSSWTSCYWDPILRAQQAGATIGATVYDLLPLRFPDSMTTHQRQVFMDWWDRAYHTVDFMTAISQSVLSEVFEYHRQHQSRLRTLPGGSFPLGANFLSTTDEAGVRFPLQELFTMRGGRAQPIYLCVGTFSPRKQQALVLDVFEKLWNQAPAATLVFIGTSGWHSEAFIQRLRSHPHWGRFLFWFSDLSDRELAWCYKNASGLIAASQGEGFNLPIVEALHYGCPVWVSDIPVHREVACGFATYFPPDSADHLATSLLQHSAHGSLEKTRSLQHFHWPNWGQCCEKLLRLVLRLSLQCQAEKGHVHRQSA